MKRFRLLIAAAVFGLVTTACSSDLVGPNPTEPSFDVTSPPTDVQGPSGQGGFGSGG
jgi:hypothetical protein